MDTDEDLPPLLVETKPEEDDVPDLINTQLDELSIIKVPITIVTGMESILPSWGLRLTGKTARLSWSR